MSPREDHGPAVPPEAWREALARLVEGESEPADDALLAAALRQEPARIGELRAQLELDAWLRQEAELSAEPFVESVAARIRPAAADDRFVRRVGQALPRTGAARWGSGVRTVRWVAAVVLVAVLAAGVFGLFPPTTAGAATILRQALQAHAARLDRCYRLEVRGQREAESPPRWQAVLWTRGNRFRNELQANGATVTWGRDEAGGVWFALSRKVGARLAADEVPEALRSACELRSLQMESLLREVLADFDLREESLSSDRTLIHAQPKPGATGSKYGSVLLEVDARTHVVQRVELERAYQGRVVATVTFALIEARLQEDASYTLAGHLDADGVVHDRTTGRAQRGQVIAEFLKVMRARAGTPAVAPQ
ncbi:MAG: hypothetical protein RJA22_2667 [Verrucomicrobiota bacterium]